MATTKQLTPDITDKTVTLPALTDTADISVISTDLSNMTDAINKNKTSVDTLNSNLTTVNQLNVTYDTDKLENVYVYKLAKIVFGTFKIKANVLTSGYNQITFSGSGMGWYIPPTASVRYSSTQDDAKNYSFSFTSVSGLQIRAEAANASSLDVSFIGIVT